MNALEQQSNKALSLCRVVVLAYLGQDYDLFERHETHSPLTFGVCFECSARVAKTSAKCFHLFSSREEGE